MSYNLLILFGSKSNGLDLRDYTFLASSQLNQKHPISLIRRHAN